MLLAGLTKPGEVGEILALYRLKSLSLDYKAKLKSLCFFLQVRESGFSQTSEINRNDLLEYKEKKVNKRVLLVLTYHPSLEKISGIVRHH